MTFEKFKQAKEAYAEWDYVSDLACNFNKGDFNETREMKIQVLTDEGLPSHTLLLTDPIRQKINELLWKEADELRKAFEAI